MESKVFTYQARIKDEGVFNFLNDSVCLFSKLERKLCFATKKLFHAQYNLESNGYNNHQEWKKDWDRARTNQFTLMGSKDETITFRIRVANCLEYKYKEHPADSINKCNLSI